MPIYVETRGSALADDYRFLGAGPSRAWWHHGYRDQTTFDHPTVLVERDENGWRLYVGAIPSSRHDPTGSTNRVTVVAESDPDEGDLVDREALLRLIGAWLADVAEQRESGRVGDALDEVFPADVVDRLYGAAGPGDVQDRVRAACSRLAEPAAEPATDMPGSWIAPVRGVVGRTAFVARVRALLDGAVEGSAIFVNLLYQAEAFARRPEDPPLAVLVTDPDEALKPDPKALPTVPEPAKKAPRPTTVSTAPSGPGRTLIAVTLLLVVVGLIWWLTGTALTPASTP